jgi:hypothetical protein
MEYIAAIGPKDPTLSELRLTTFEQAEVAILVAWLNYHLLLTENKMTIEGNSSIAFSTKENPVRLELGPTASSNNVVRAVMKRFHEVGWECRAFDVPMKTLSMHFWALSG